MDTPSGFMMLGELLWPADDRDCYRAAFKEKARLYEMYEFCGDRFGVAVQAGGNCGVWPLELAAKFKRVLTFEPDARNFQALVWNTRETPNVVAMRGALGNKAQAGALCGLNRIPGNVGAHQVAMERQDDFIPMMYIDYFKLPACDLLCLDVEGYEFLVLDGASETIGKYRPLIVLEDKGLSKLREGPECVPDWVCEKFNYELVAAWDRDVVLRSKK
jgi:FkbM family methyltransferase